MMDSSHSELPLFQGIIELDEAYFGGNPHMAQLHLNRYLRKFEFRWNNRVAEKTIDKNGCRKTVMRPIPIMDMIIILLIQFYGYFLK